jgi:hypothetical protein
VDLSTAILHAITDRPLVNIQPDVIHTLHGGAPFAVSESARSLSSVLYTCAPPPPYTFKLTRHAEYFQVARYSGAAKRQRELRFLLSTGRRFGPP